MRNHDESQNAGSNQIGLRGPDRDEVPQLLVMGVHQPAYGDQGKLGVYILTSHNLMQNPVIVNSLTDMVSSGMSDA